jgi:4-amino-4-deoxy-L-arabinose transferase-like glycosyltransferase
MLSLPQKISWKETIAFFVFITFLVTIESTLSNEAPNPVADQTRYIDYAINLHFNNTFGLSRGSLTTTPEKSIANVPLYPWLVSLVMKIDPDLTETLVCIHTHRTWINYCKLKLDTLVFFQHILIIISLMLIWITCHVLFESITIAWAAPIFALLSEFLTEFTQTILTEVLILPLFLSLQLFILLFLKYKNAKWGIAIGISLGLLCLTRSEYIYLAYFMIAIALISLIKKPPRFILYGYISSVLVMVVTISPWSIRNNYNFNTYSLTKGNYAEIVLSERIGFNSMTSKEWLSSFVYWAPKGENIASDYIPKAWYERFENDSTGLNDFRRIGLEEIYSNVTSSTDKPYALSQIVRDHILAKPIKHIITTIPLIWRGIFVGQRWGLVGLFLHLCLLITLIKTKNYELLWLSLPIWFIVTFHALVSVSIERYNLPLLSIYAIGYGYFFTKLINKIMNWKYNRKPLKSL